MEYFSYISIGGVGRTAEKHRRTRSSTAYSLQSPGGTLVVGQIELFLSSKAGLRGPKETPDASEQDPACRQRSRESGGIRASPPRSPPLGQVKAMSIKVQRTKLFEHGARMRPVMVRLEVRSEASSLRLSNLKQ